MPVDRARQRSGIAQSGILTTRHAFFRALIFLIGVHACRVEFSIMHRPVGCCVQFHRGVLTSAGKIVDFRVWCPLGASSALATPQPLIRKVARGLWWKSVQRSTTSLHHSPQSLGADLAQHFELGGLNHHLIPRPTELPPRARARARGTPTDATR